jgi:DNA-nicking Smr family endonuclease
MDFKHILDEWERRNPKAALMPKAADRASADSKGAGHPGEKRRRLLAKKPDARIDLHGLTQDEAWDRLILFFEDARCAGLEKILIIHGKGRHSPFSAPLKKLAQDFIERCPAAGENGPASAAQGGDGATWVLIK